MIGRCWSSRCPSQSARPGTTSTSPRLTVICLAAVSPRGQRQGAHSCHPNQRPPAPKMAKAFRRKARKSLPVCMLHESSRFADCRISSRCVAFCRGSPALNPAKVRPACRDVKMALYRCILASPKRNPQGMSLAQEQSQSRPAKTSQVGSNSLRHRETRHRQVTTDRLSDQPSLGFLLRTEQYVGPAELSCSVRAAAQHDNFDPHSMGSRTVTVAPSPGSLIRWILPP